MLTAIPMHGNRIAGHLARAPQVAIFDQRGCEIARYDNPAAAEHCAGKKQLLALLRQHQVQRLVVRNVGQHMAQRLLAMGLEIRLTKGAISKAPTARIAARCRRSPIRRRPVRRARRTTARTAAAVGATTARSQPHLRCCSRVTARTARRTSYAANVSSASSAGRERARLPHTNLASI